MTESFDICLFLRLALLRVGECVDEYVAESFELGAAFGHVANVFLGYLFFLFYPDEFKNKVS